MNTTIEYSSTGLLQVSSGLLLCGENPAPCCVEDQLSCASTAESLQVEIQTLSSGSIHTVQIEIVMFCL